MFKNFSVVVLVVFVLGFFATVEVSGQNDSVTVTIKNGPIVGKIYKEQNQDINQFLGIPFAEPPVNELRFRRPKPYQRKWTEPMQATKWPKNCYQFEKLLESHYYRNTEFSEDCLYLNVWSPKVNEIDEQKLRPVIVFFHGGGLILGGSSFNFYDGKTLSSLADAVVVTVNYRLSILGFLYSEEVEDVKGNQGLWDQTQALEWIQENIRYFGGDPKQVTISGESAGSWSVSSHVLSPVSRGLFSKAYMMSGSVTHMIVSEPEVLSAKLLHGIRKIGCATESDTVLTKTVVECLEKLPANVVDSIYYMTGNPFHSIVVVDGTFLPKHPLKMLAEGNHKKNFHLLVSSFEDESSYEFFLFSNNPKYARENPEPLTIDDAKKTLMEKIVVGVPKIGQNPKKLKTIEKIYFNGVDPDNLSEDNQNLFRKLTSMAYGDMFMTCPTIDFARKIFSSSPDTVKVYQAYYTAKLGAIKFLESNWSGAAHFNDIYYLFGLPINDDRQQYLEREREISHEVIDFVKSFIRTGTVGPNHSEWQSYFLSDLGETIAPSYEISSKPRTYQNYHIDLKQTQCRVWSDYFY